MTVHLEPSRLRYPTYRFWSARTESLSEACGLVLPDQRRETFFAVLRELSGGVTPGSGFIYVSAPLDLGCEDLAAVVSCVEAGQLRDRLCIGVRRPDDGCNIEGLCRSASSLGLRFVLEGVDETTPFGDLRRHAVCAVAIAPSLIAAALTHPASACIVESIAHLASNLGLMTIAAEVPRGTQSHIAALGIQYVGEFTRSGQESVEVGHFRSRSRYQDARHAP